MNADLEDFLLVNSSLWNLTSWRSILLQRLDDIETTINALNDSALETLARSIITDGQVIK